MSEKFIFIISTYYPNVEKLSHLIAMLSPMNILIIDNTPQSDKTFSQQIKEKKLPLQPNVEITEMKQNTGYAGAINHGLQKSYTLGYTWMIIVNDDITIDKEAVDSTIKQLTKLNPGIAGPFPRSLDIRRWTTIDNRNNENSSADYLSGSYLAVHRDIINNIGYLYEPYFLFYEEVEYCVRAKKTGFPLYTIFLENIKHTESSSFVNRVFLHQYYLARNHLLFVERNAPPSVKFYEFIRFPKTMIEHIHRKEWGAVEGIRDYIFRKFGPHKKSIL